MIGTFAVVAVALLVAIAVGALVHWRDRSASLTVLRETDNAETNLFRL